MIQATLIGLLLVVGGGTADARVGLPEVAKNRAHLGGAWSPGTTHVAGFDRNDGQHVDGRGRFCLARRPDGQTSVSGPPTMTVPGCFAVCTSPRDSDSSSKPAGAHVDDREGRLRTGLMANADSRFDLQINPLWLVDSTSCSESKSGA